MNTKNKLADMLIQPLLYTMAVPLMLSLLVQSLYNIVDSMFVAKLSETALTAASLVYSIQFLMIAVGVGTAVGLNALLSRKIGQHKPEEACQAATTGLFLILITSLIFSITGIFFSSFPFCNSSFHFFFFPSTMDQCFQLQIRRFLGFRFVPVEFDLPPFQLSVPEISRGFLEGPHNEKDASTFVLIFCTLFILHNIPIHSFGFVYLTINKHEWFQL